MQLRIFGRNRSKGRRSKVARALFETMEQRLYFVNSDVFLATSMSSNVYNWGTASNWSENAVPGTNDAAFVNGNHTASITAQTPAINTTNIYVGQGPNATIILNGGTTYPAAPATGYVNMTGGTVNATGVYLGVDTQQYGLWYQTGGTLNATTAINVGGNQSSTSVGTHGTFIVDGSSVDVTPATYVGNQGYGELTVGGGSLTTGTLNIATSATSSNNSYANEGSGTLSISGNISVGNTALGSHGMLKISGGTFGWAGNLDVSSGSTFDVQSNSGSDAWNGTSGTALSIESGGALEFDLSSVSGTALNLNAGVLNIGANASLVIDGTQLNGTDTSAHTLTLAQAGSISGSFSTSNIKLVGFEDRTASVSVSGGKITLTLSKTNIVPGPEVAASGTVTTTNTTDTALPSSIPVGSVAYSYGPAFIYDAAEGLYKVWTTYAVNQDLSGNSTGWWQAYNPNTGGNNAYNLLGGDTIGYKQSPTIAGLQNSAVTLSMIPSGLAGHFDAGLVADPSVYQDATNNYYLAYTGAATTLPVGTDTTIESRIGIATSLNGGRTFSPQYTANSSMLYALVDPSNARSTKESWMNGEGIGQPSVVYANGQWNMILTDVENAPTPGTDDVITSSSPTFATIAYGPTIPISPSNNVGNSVSAAYDPSSGQFLVITDSSPSNSSSETNSYLYFSYFDSNWTFQAKQVVPINGQGFGFQEGVAVLTDTKGQLLTPGTYELMGATTNINPYLQATPYGGSQGSTSFVNVVSPSISPLTANASYYIFSNTPVGYGGAITSGTQGSAATNSVFSKGSSLQQWTAVPTTITLNGSTVPDGYYALTNGSLVLQANTGATVTLATYNANNVLGSQRWLLQWYDNNAYLIINKGDLGAGLALAAAGVGSTFALTRSSYLTNTSTGILSPQQNNDLWTFSNSNSGAEPFRPTFSNSGSVPDGSFESPVQTAPNYFQYDPASTQTQPWVFQGNSGITANGTAFTSGNAAAPDGTQQAFIQNTGSIYESIYVAQGGNYTLCFSAAQRLNEPPPADSENLEVAMDDNSKLLVNSLALSGTWSTYGIQLTLSAGAHTLLFQGVAGNSNGNTVFIDNVSLSPTIANGGFENPAQAAPNYYSYNPAASGIQPWTFSSSNNAGITANNTAFTSGNAPAPQGTQQAFIQNNGSMSENVPLTAGEVYTLNFYAAERAGGLGGEPFQVQIGNQTFPYSALGGSSWTNLSVTFTANATGSQSVQFVGTNPANDNTTIFFDNITLASAGNLGFEVPNVGNSYAYAPTNAGWAFLGTNVSGIAGNGSAFFASGNTIAPEGLQEGIIQNNGGFDQNFLFPQSGSYLLSFSAAQRAGGSGSEPFQVLLDGSVVATYQPEALTWLNKLLPLNIPSSGSHNIEFQGLTPSGGNTEFIDNVALTQTMS